MKDAKKEMNNLTEKQSDTLKDKEYWDTHLAEFAEEMMGIKLSLYQRAVLNMFSMRNDFYNKIVKIIRWIKSN